MRSDKRETAAEQRGWGGGWPPYPVCLAAFRQCQRFFSHLCAALGFGGLACFLPSPQQLVSHQPSAVALLEYGPGKVLPRSSEPASWWGSPCAGGETTFYKHITGGTNGTVELE